MPKTQKKLSGPQTSEYSGSFLCGNWAKMYVDKTKIWGQQGKWQILSSLKTLWLCKNVENISTLAVASCPGTIFSDFIFLLVNNFLSRPHPGMPHSLTSTVIKING